MSDHLRELDQRSHDGIDVLLLWRERDGRAAVTVADAKTGERFSIEVPDGEPALRVFHHQLGLDALPGRPADDELAGLMPTIFEYVDALGIYTFDADRRAGQLRPLRAA